jgi:hypothetical protein
MQDFAEIQSKDSLFLEINERRAKLRHAPEIVENEWWKKMEIDCTNTYKKNAFPLRFKLPPHDFKEKYYAEFFCFLSPYINSADKKKFINRFMLIRGQYDMEDRWRRISQGIIAPNTHDPLLIEKNPFIYGEDIHSFVCDFMTQISMTGYSSPTIIDRKACPTFLSQINPHFPKK